MVTRNATLLLFVSMMGLLASDGRAETFNVLAWNVESNRPGQSPVSDADTIAKQLTELMANAETRSQVIALSEVEPKHVIQYKDAVATGLSTEVDYVTSASGGFQDTDTVMLIVDKSRFELESAVELHRWGGEVGNFNVDDAKSEEHGTVRARSPLAVKLIDKVSGQKFWVIANHLARGEADLRTSQAKMLVKWAQSAGLPAISAGDHNFDYDFKTEKGNAGYDAMIDGGIWEWLKPDPLIDSNWTTDRRSTPENPIDRYPDSILDFVFVANGAKQWHGECDVVVREGDFPDTDKTSDHRPLIARFNPTITSN